MHIALVTETYPPQINGVALTVQNLALGLREMGTRVDVVRPALDGEAPGDNGSDESGGSELRLPGAALPYYPGLRFGWPAGRSLRRRWASSRPDAIYIATEGPLGWSALNAARLMGIPVASGFHTRFDQCLQRYGLNLLAPAAFGWLRWFHNQSDVTLVPTRELARELLARGFHSVEQLSRGVDAGAFNPACRSAALRARWRAEGGDAPVLIHVGRVAPEKNLDLAIRAYRAIKAQQPAARMLMVGDGPLRATLEAANPDILFTGMLRGRELAEHFASADIFLFPSLSETFGNVTLEAMASGIATVAYNYGAAREVLRDGEHGRAVACGDEAGFIAAALQLAADPELRRRMGQAARAAIVPMQPQQVCEDFSALLSGLALKGLA